MNPIRSNINNLISLWQSADKSQSSHHKGEAFSVQTAINSEWPNKLWFTGSIDEQIIHSAKDFIQSSLVQLSVPHWHTEDNDTRQLFATAGFEVAFEQTGMSLALNGSYKTDSALNISKVSDQASARLWSSLFEQAFGYHLDSHLLLPQQQTDLLVAHYQGAPVGTGIIHYSDVHIAGIHAMGIIPSMRRKGFAEEMMHDMLNRASEKNASHATLQASTMGKGLYLKMGFQEDFLQTNYQLK
ncbi:MAG: GNAT family N-acetyltransferase [Roseivirga sp.]|nr:GNAT family N-acetyltransferase [Roseivirga sp.]